MLSTVTDSIIELTFPLPQVINLDHLLQDKPFCVPLLALSLIYYNTSPPNTCILQWSGRQLLCLSYQFFSLEP